MSGVMGGDSLEGGREGRVREGEGGREGGMCNGGREGGRDKGVKGEREAKGGRGERQMKLRNTKRSTDLPIQQQFCSRECSEY